MSVATFWVAVVDYCDLFDGSVTSGPRSVKHNKAVGGVAHSAHLEGLGADVVLDDVKAHPISERQEWCEQEGLHLIVEGDHDHLQPRGWVPG